ncbi:sulfatase-like hydrolase/transferase [bacterium]|nr:sulfatase-like hydrolase/transferase [bacterium]
MSDTDRRAFLRSVGATGAAMAVPALAQDGKEPRRPNIVFIITDQQSATMMSCTGNGTLKTPAMDRLAASGVRFERAYTTNPVCLPARFGFVTGQYPSVVGVGKNEEGGQATVTPAIQRQAMGHVLRRAGYETVYGGKTHLPRRMGLEQIGFRQLTRDSRGKLADACASYLKQPHAKPFLLVASFINPHDICYMAINDHARSQGKPPVGNLDSRICEGLIDEPRKKLKEFVAQHCPPLPANHGVPALEPECITRRYVAARRFRLYAREKWSGDLWRLHRWAYCRLTEMVDAHVGKVLDAVRDAGLEDNTLIIFTSDHGDHDGAHGLEHKSILYEEAARIPFLMSYKGAIPAGRVDEAHLVSNGLDLLPALCDYAGVAPPEGLHGASLRAIAEGRPTATWRDHLVIESQNGRMVRTKRHKYNVYDSGKHREQLINLEADPGEMTNLAEDPRHKATLDQHRALLQRWVEATGDTIAAKYIVRSG